MTRITKKERQHRVQRRNRLEKGFKAFEEGTNALIADMRARNDPDLTDANDLYLTLHATYRARIVAADRAVEDADRALGDR